MKKQSDSKYLEWLRKQPSCISHEYSEWHAGVGYNPACHVRRAGAAGIAYKPLFSAIPLTHSEHRVQSEQGELACLQTFCPELEIESAAAAKAWFDKQAAYYLKRWQLLQ